MKLEIDDQSNTKFLFISKLCPKIAVGLNTYMLDKNIQVSSFKSNEILQKKEGGPDCTVSNNKFSSVTLNEIAMNDRENIL